jgi:RNA polymerase sigma-70 factor (ECF subfamily)
MTTYDVINKQLNDEMQCLAKTIQSGEYTERHRNRLATIMMPKLKFFIWKFFKNSDEAEHVLGQTLLKIFSGISSYNPDYRFTTWIYTIARNEALLHQHNLKVQYMVSLDTMLAPINTKDDSLFTMEREEFMDALYKLTISEIVDLPDSLEKEILIDKELHLMKGNEISEKYNMNLNTVKTKIRKARRILKDAVLSKNPEMADKLEDYI